MNFSSETPESNPPIGYVVGGGLKENLRVRRLQSAGNVQEGSFVVIQNGDWQFYGLVTDMQLGATDERFADEQTGRRLPAGLAALLQGQTLYTNLEVMPALMFEVGPPPGDPRYAEWRHRQTEEPHPMPVKTIPAHHAEVRLAEAVDIATIFGQPSQQGNFTIGYTREQGHPVCIDLKKFVQRSSGVFGATGTGKSFLTRILLAGLIQYDQASVLVFDMHNEYGFDDVASDTRQHVPGLRTKFNTRVRVVGLGANATIKGMSPDLTLTIAEEDILPEDIEMLGRELNLRDTTPTVLAALWKEFGRQWFSKFKAMKPGATVEDENGKRIPAPDSVEGWAQRCNVHPMAAESLHSKMGKLFDRPYIVSHPAQDVVKHMVAELEGNRHIILSFGDYDTDLDYLLVTNLLTRRIRQNWVEKTNRFRSQKEQEPRPLVIVLEEAHKLLNFEMASQTTFSTVAREMRKYYVTLLVVDQRPSQIYDEVLSQLGTRISGWLGDDSDISAVLSGLAGRDTLRGMLSRLQPSQEVLLLGWGVPMPLPVRSRRYDDRFWQELKGENKKPGSVDQILDELGFS